MACPTGPWPLSSVTRTQDRLAELRAESPEGWKFIISKRKKGASPRNSGHPHQAAARCSQKITSEMRPWPFSFPLAGGGVCVCVCVTGDKAVQNTGTAERKDFPQNEKRVAVRS